MTPSIADVAREAGTSPATISRVIAGSVPVSAALRERALRAIRALNYQPNRAAQSLRAQACVRPKGLEHGTLLVPAWGGGDMGAFHRSQGAIYEGIVEAAHRRNLQVLLKFVPPDQCRFPFAPACLADAKFDGILATPHPDVNSLGLQSAGPVVWYGSRPADMAGASVVEPDSAAGIEALMRRLHGLGHRRIAFLSETQSHLPYVDRLNAFRTLALSLGLEPCAPRECLEGAEDLPAWVRSVRESPRPPTAILCASDGMGIDVVQALQATGLRVPQDVSVTGFDGREKSRWSTPALTTWAVDWDAMGQAAVDQLLAMIERQAPPVRILTGGRLLDQGSTAPPGLSGHA